MIHHPLLKDGQWLEASFPVSGFQAVSPNSNRQLPERFPVSSFLDIDEMLQAHAGQALEKLPLSKQKVGDFLKLTADLIEQQKNALLDMAAQETGLAKDEFLACDFASMLSHMRECANLAAGNNSVTEFSDNDSNFVVKKEPFAGPVIIFGPSNSPFFLNSCCGANFSAAIAAGNAVIAKGNPNHPMTCLLLAETVHKALMQLELTPILFQFFHHTTTDLGYRLAAHPMIGAFSFAGNRKNALALKENADRSNNPFFNDARFSLPVFIYPEAIVDGPLDLEKGLAQSLLCASGQQSGKPGPIFVLEDKNASQLVRKLSEELGRNSAPPLLSDLKARALDSLVADLLRLGARKLSRKDFYAPAPFVYPHTVLLADYKTFRKFPRHFQETAPGPLLTFITLENFSQFHEAARLLDAGPSAIVISSANSEIKPVVSELKRRFSTLSLLSPAQTDFLKPSRLPAPLTCCLNIKRFSTTGCLETFASEA